MKVLPVYITLLWFLSSEGFSDAHECLLHSPRWKHGYLCEFLHTCQQYEAFSTFFTLTGCFSAFIFGGFVFMWFSSGGRCLYYRTKFLHTLDWYGLSYVSSLVCRVGWLTASPDDSRDLTSGNRHSIQTVPQLCVSDVQWAVSAAETSSPSTFENSEGHLVEIFPSASVQKVSQLWGFSNVYIGLTCVRFYNSEFCDINGEMTCLKHFSMFFRPAHQCELKFRDGPPD